MGCSDDDIAVAFGVTRTHVLNLLAIDNLTSEVKNAIEEKRIKATAATKLKNLSHEEQVAVLEYLRKTKIKPTVENIKDIVETRIFESQANEESETQPAPVRYKAQPKKRLEKRLSLFEENGFAGDRYLQSKPADYREGFAYALKWALGREQEDEPFDAVDADSDINEE